MDWRTRVLLKNWALAKYIDTFRENQIDYGKFLKLSNSTLERLFEGRLGPLVKYHAKIQQFIKFNGEERDLFFKRFGDFDEGGSTCCPVEDTPGADEDHNIDDIFPQQPHREPTWNTETAASRLSCHQVDKTPSSPIDCGLKSKANMSSPSEQKPLSSPTDLVSGKEASDETTYRTAVKRLWIHADNNGRSPNSKKIRAKAVENVVEFYLRHTCIGCALLRIGAKQHLSRGARLMMCYEIMINELQSNPNTLVAYRRLEALARDIIELFPNEKMETYYSLEKTTSRRAFNGLLCSVHRNFMRLMRAAGVRDRDIVASNPGRIAKPENIAKPGSVALAVK